MLYAFLIALALELLGKSETLKKAIAYLIVAVLAATGLTLFFGWLLPLVEVEVTEVAWDIFIGLSIVYSVVGLLVGKGARRVAEARI